MLLTKGRIAIAAALGLASIAVCASLALATEITRTEYREAVEPICKANANASKRILAGVRTEVKQGQLKAAASQFAKAAEALMKAYRELDAVPKPAADATRLSKWLSYLKLEVELLQRASKALGSGEVNRTRGIVVRLTREANLANSQIFIFDLRSCTFEPSQYA